MTQSKKKSNHKISDAKNDGDLVLSHPPGAAVPKEATLADDTYIDPISGFLAFTASYHLRRGYCCKSGCRHCPYGFKG